MDPARCVGQKVKFGPVEVDVGSLKINAYGKDLPISEREARIIQLFAANIGRVISRDELYEKIWQESMEEIETRTVDMHIAKLRSKIEKDHATPTIIKTVRGTGYIYEQN